VSVLVTSVGAGAADVRTVFAEEGYREHAASAELDRDNRGLGAPGLERHWNRPGHFHLLEVDPAAAARADALAHHRALGGAEP